SSSMSRGTSASGVFSPSGSSKRNAGVGRDVGMIPCVGIPGVGIAGVGFAVAVPDSAANPGSVIRSTRCGVAGIDDTMSKSGSGTRAIGCASMDAGVGGRTTGGSIGVGDRTIGGSIGVGDRTIGGSIGVGERTTGVSSGVGECRSGKSSIGVGARIVGADSAGV